MPFAYQVAEEEIKLFKSSQHAELYIVHGGGHYLNATHPDVIAEKLAGFVKTFHKKA